MTQESYPNKSEEVVASGAGTSSNSSNTLSTDVYPLPFSLGQKEIVWNNEERALVPDGNILASDTNINFDGCNDVHVGNNTFFNGDVTIYQNIQGTNLRDLPNVRDEVECNKNGQVINSESKPSESKSFPKDFKQLLKDRPTQLWSAGILLALISMVSLVVYFSVAVNFTHTPVPGEPPNGHTDDLGDGIQVIQRKEWLARDPLYVTKFTTPPKMVRIMHSVGANCSDYQSCANKVLSLQGQHVGGKGMPDIAYNYLIGGDGGVYIGRGADVESDGKNGTMDIAYVGNYLAPFDKMSDKMEESGKKLIARLLERGKVTKDYILVADNQTEKTTSPGENVYKKIIHWPHYDAGLYIEKEE